MSAATSNTSPVTVVLVHGAFADASSWSGVIERLQAAGAAGTDVIRSMTERAGATITEVEASHVVMVSQPDAVAEVVLTAAAAVDRMAAAEGR